MNFFKKFFASKVIEKKGLPFSPYMSFVNFLALNGWSNLSAFQAMQYYMQVSPLYDAISKVAKECASIRLFVQNQKTEKFEKNHQVLDLLKHPNTDIGASEFMEQLISYFLITGNAYLIATGLTTSAPKELFIISPEYVTLIPDEADGYTKYINYTSSQKNLHFTRQEINGRFRFYSDSGLQEIFHIRMFNPIKGITNNYGLSPLAPIYYEIEQYIKAGVHNLSLLARGGRPSGAFISPETLSDDSFARLQQQLELFNSGAENAGRVLLLENNLEYKEMGQTNKDMDFDKLKERLTTQIYNVFSIPLPLIASGHMSYNNLETAKLSLYDFAVLPVLSRILEELTNFLMYRYGEQDKLAIVYNKDSIPALQIRRNEELTIVKNLGVNTINEIRKMRGDLPVTGGDDIYVPGGLYPVGSTGRIIEEAEEEEINAEDSKRALYLDYYARVKRIKNVKGQPAFNDDQIKTLAVEYGLGNN